MCRITPNLAGTLQLLPTIRTPFTSSECVDAFSRVRTAYDSLHTYLITSAVSMYLFFFYLYPCFYQFFFYNLLFLSGLLLTSKTNEESQNVSLNEHNQQESSHKKNKHF